MMEVFEYRSQIEEVESEGELDPINMEITCKYEEAVNQIKEAVTDGAKDVELIKYLMQEMKYWHQVLSIIDLRRDELTQ